MFNFISWQQFICWLAIVLILYYILVVFLYYKRDIMSKWTKRNATPSGAVGRSDYHENDLFVIASTLKTGIEQIVDEGTAHGWIKEELLYALSNRIQQDYKLRGTSFQPAINNHVRQLSLNSLQISLDDDDLVRLW